MFWSELVRSYLTIDNGNCSKVIGAVVSSFLILRIFLYWVTGMLRTPFAGGDLPDHPDAVQRGDFALSSESLGSGESKLETTVSYVLIVGVIVSLTVIGAVVGIPLAILGLLLVIRGLF